MSAEMTERDPEEALTELDSEDAAFAEKLESGAAPPARILGQGVLVADDSSVVRHLVRTVVA